MNDDISEFELKRVEQEELKSDVCKEHDVNLHENIGTVFDLTCMNEVASTYAGQVCLPSLPTKVGCGTVVLTWGASYTYVFRKI